VKQVWHSRCVLSPTITRRAKQPPPSVTSPVKPRHGKYSTLPKFGFIVQAKHPGPDKGRIAIVPNCGPGCDGRDGVGHDGCRRAALAVSNGFHADDTTLTASSHGFGCEHTPAPEATCEDVRGRTSRVVLTPKDTLKPSRREGRAIRRTCGPPRVHFLGRTDLRVPAGARPSLRPRLCEGAKRRANLGHNAPREGGRSPAFEMRIGATTRSVVARLDRVLRDSRDGRVDPGRNSVSVDLNQYGRLSVRHRYVGPTWRTLQCANGL
jgi:hypothetical protein